VTASERGLVLPIVLLLILGLTALSTSALVLARAELVSDRAGQRYVRDRDAAERVLRGSATTPQGFERVETELSAGFRLVEARPAVLGLSYFAVEWVLDPDSVVARLPHALETGGTPPTAGVEAHEGCVNPGARPLVSRRPPSIGPDGALGEIPPRLGLLGVRELLELPGTDLTPPAPLPVLAASEILLARGPSVEVGGGVGSGLLVSEGDLVLDGTTRFSGILIVGGNLTLQGGAVFEGVAVVGGEAEVSGAARLLGCPDFARDVLRLPELARGHALPDGWFLGRY
jgi:hypothetical protein